MTFILANPGKMPPHGWKFFQSETQWSVRTPKNIDFNGAVGQIKKHRLANPQFKLATDDKEIAQELILFTAARMNYDSAWVTPSDAEARAFMNGGKAPMDAVVPATRGCKTCG